MNGADIGMVIVCRITSTSRPAVLSRWSPLNEMSLKWAAQNYFRWFPFELLCLNPPFSAHSSFKTGPERHSVSLWHPAMWSCLAGSSSLGLTSAALWELWHDYMVRETVAEQMANLGDSDQTNKTQKWFSCQDLVFTSRPLILFSLLWPLRIRKVVLWHLQTVCLVCPPLTVVMIRHTSQQSTLQCCEWDQLNQCWQRI
jgi:hypothetical protein